MNPTPRNPALSFRDLKGRTWGYQLPHLLAMHFRKAENLPGALDAIKLCFSTESVLIRGTSLAILWEHLVEGTPTESTDATKSGYAITDIRILPHVGS